jgi:cytochrome c peroxidase
VRIFRTACLLLVCLSLPLVSAGQSLGNVAKKERERREKNKKEGVASREFSEEEVFGEKEEEKAPEGEAGEENESSDGPSNEADEAAVIPGVDKNLEDDGDRFEKESRERKRSEAEWRSRVSNARARIAEAREAVQFFEELVLPPDSRYVDANGHTVIESTEHLQRLTREAKEELAAAELDLRQIQDEARRAGIPPGWLR